MGVLVLALTPTLGLTQGFFGGIPGLPSFGGALGGTGACGEKSCAPAAGPSLYVGWMEDRDGTSISVDLRNVAVANLSSFTHHFTNRGLWLGVAQAVPFNDRFGFLASGWYLVPSATNSRETYSTDVVLLSGERTWDTDTKWWFVDGLFCINAPAGMSFLAGLRYDYLTTRFKNPQDVANLLSLPTDTADVIIENWIPLFGTQVTYAGSFGNLVVRAVGVPTLLGTVRYRQNVGAAILGPASIEAKGNWKQGYFLEFFADYSKSFGPGAVGVFGRWNMAQGEATTSVDAILAGAAAFFSQDYDLTALRKSWTLGGTFSLAFNMPGIPGI
jgi:hypothetical protein